MHSLTEVDFAIQTRASALHAPKNPSQPTAHAAALGCVTQDLASELQSASELGLELAQETITCLGAPEEEGGGEAEGERIGMWQDALGS